MTAAVTAVRVTNITQTTCDIEADVVDITSCRIRVTSAPSQTTTVQQSALKTPVGGVLGGFTFTMGTAGTTFYVWFMNVTETSTGASIGNIAGPSFTMASVPVDPPVDPPPTGVGSVTDQAFAELAAGGFTGGTLRDRQTVELASLGETTGTYRDRAKRANKKIFPK